ncbi:MAG: GatB/YqeY domain-containing protein [Bacteroidaceae bacterium]
MSLFEKVSEDIKKAMKARDKVALDTLRNVKKFFLEAKTAPGANDELTDATAQQIITKLAKQGNESAKIYIEQNREDLANEELEQVKILNKYMPKQLTSEELTELIKSFIEQVGATSPKDMGKVMGIASKQLAGKADGRAISTEVKEQLNSL